MIKCLDRGPARVFGAVALLSLFSLGHADDMKPKPLMKNFMGINAHAFFKPDVYKAVVINTRNYHPIVWDNDGDSSFLPPFPIGKDHITDNNPINWATHFGGWKKAGIATIDDSIQIEMIAPDKWKDMEKDAFAYGQAYAKALGPSSTGAVDSVEIGNEPGRDPWTAPVYKKIFQSMAKGFKDGDPKLKVVTSWSTANVTEKYSQPMDNLKGLDDIYDVINIHTYSMIEGYPTWRRVHPEHANIDYLKVLSEMADWRNNKAPGKEIWITEFGYDAGTKHGEPGTFANWISSTETEQAQWLVRSFFAFCTVDVDRAYIYDWDDGDRGIFHGSSGITRNFKPKPSFYALVHLQKTLGDYAFSKVIVKRDQSPKDEAAHDLTYKQAKKEAPKPEKLPTEHPSETIPTEHPSDSGDKTDAPKGDEIKPDQPADEASKGEQPLYVYEFVNPDKPSEPIWAAWMPSGSQRESVQEIQIPSGSQVVKAERMPLKDGDPEIVECKPSANGIELKVTESPVYIWLKQ